MFSQEEETHARPVLTLQDNGRHRCRWRHRHLYIHHTDIGSSSSGFRHDTTGGCENALGRT
jgi:hypothetical protein